MPEITRKDGAQGMDGMGGGGMGIHPLKGSTVGPP